MTTETISSIQDWLKNQEVADPVELKARDRVTRTVAEGIKANKRPDKGSCNFCSTEAERLNPIQMACCVNCVSKYMRHGKGLEILKVETKSFLCDRCFCHGFKRFFINPKICDRCLQKLGKRHKHRRGILLRNKARQQNSRMGIPQ
ncbi:hypothetical protein IIA15_00975 [candidate division TA06 bacterium]|nr:hypothetical protein [candidate division TA06 bacterium]